MQSLSFFASFKNAFPPRACRVCGRTILSMDQSRSATKCWRSILFQGILKLCLQASKEGTISKFNKQNKVSCSCLPGLETSFVACGLSYCALVSYFAMRCKLFVSDDCVHMLPNVQCSKFRCNCVSFKMQKIEEKIPIFNVGNLPSVEARQERAILIRTSRCWLFCTEKC